MRNPRIKLLITVVIAIAMCIVPAYADEEFSFSSLKKADDTHVYMGMYPQIEVVGDVNQYASSKWTWAKESDYIVDATLYGKLQAATWNNNETTIGEDKYRRMKKSDALYTGTDGMQYVWADDSTYHYFKYEPIKWRVLSMTSSEALLFCDTVIDDQKYNSVDGNVTWETASVRTWLNNTFFNTAFSDKEQGIILNSSLANSVNNAKGISGGNNTQDKVFLLSEAEVSGEGGAANGFASSITETDAAKQLKSSTYAKARGTRAYRETGNAYWWLRTPGLSTAKTEFVYYSGYVYTSGESPTIDKYGVCPAVRVKVITTDISSFVCKLEHSHYAYNGSAVKPKVSVGDLVEGVDYTVAYSNNNAVGTGKITITGKGAYTGKIEKTFEIHKMTKVAAKASTCTVQGNIEYWNCTCGKRFSDANGYNEVSAADCMLALKDHNYQTVALKKATLTTDGYKEHRECSMCHNKQDYVVIPHIDETSLEMKETSFVYDGTAKEPLVAIKDANGDYLNPDTAYDVSYANNINAGTGSVTLTFKGNYSGSVTGHFAIIDTSCHHVDAIAIPAVAAKCTTPGNTAYWYCENCNTYFSDEECSNVILEDSWVIPARGHSWKTHKIADGKYKKGKTWDQCERCNATKNTKILPGWADSYVKSMKLKKGKKCFTVKWKKQSKKNQKKFSGYQIRYSLKSSMAGCKYKTAKKSSSSKKISKLKKKTYYYVQVRTYRKIGKNTFYSKWSAKKKVKTK